MTNRIKLNIFRIFVLSTVSFVLTACGSSEDNSATQNPAKAQAQVVPLDANRQGIYDTNCGVCHSMEGSGAPQSGVAADWQDRISAGMDGMVNKAMDGFQGMPAMGGCFDCTEEDFSHLISYMTNGAVKQ